MIVRQPRIAPKADLHRPVSLSQQSNRALRLHALAEAKSFVELVERKVLTVAAAERCLGVEEKQKRTLLRFADLEVGRPTGRMVLQALDLRTRALTEFRRRVRFAGFSLQD